MEKLPLESGLCVQARPALLHDLTACLDLVPDWLPLDSQLRNQLPDIWAKLLFQPSFNALVIEDLAGSKRLLALGMSIALNKQWQERLTCNPRPFLGAQIYSALADGSFEPPSAQELSAMDANGSVTFAVLHYLQKPFDLSDPDAIKLYCAGMNGFRVMHSGYRLRQMYKEGCGKVELHFLEGMGFRPYTQRAVQSGREFGDPAYPELCGLSDEEAASLLPGTPVRDIFQFSSPTFGFSPSERRLLRLAIHDLPDEIVCEQLKSSSHTIKKLWQSIHQRVASRMPSLYGDTPVEKNTTDPTRGREKRRTLIAYLRQHLEELRPCSMKRHSSR